MNLFRWIFVLFLGGIVARAEPSNAMWVYHTEATTSSDAAMAELLQFCKERKIEELYWDVRYRRQPDGSTLLLEQPGLRELLQRATAAHLRVHALSGEPDDAEPQHHARVLARVEATLRFNEAGAAEARFIGVHLDIEPHAAATWKTASAEERTAQLANLVLVHQKAARLLRERAPGLLYGADVVFWLGKQHASGQPVYPVTVDGQTADPEQHLLQVVDQLALMSYRSFPEGSNGTIQLVRRAVERARNTRAKVYVGVKMANIGPPLETFYGQPETKLRQSVQAIHQAFRKQPGYGGVTYFMYEAYRQMPRE